MINVFVKKFVCRFTSQFNQVMTPLFCSFYTKIRKSYLSFSFFSHQARKAAKWVYAQIKLNRLMTSMMINTAIIHAQWLSSFFYRKQYFKRRIRKWKILHGLSYWILISNVHIINFEHCAIFKLDNLYERVQFSMNLNNLQIIEMNGILLRNQLNA